MLPWPRRAASAPESVPWLWSPRRVFRAQRRDSLDGEIGRVTFVAAWVGCTSAIGYVFAYGACAVALAALSLCALGLIFTLVLHDRLRLAWLARVRQGREAGWSITEPTNVAGERLALPLHHSPGAPYMALVREHPEAHEGSRAVESRQTVALVEREADKLPASVKARRRAAAMALAVVAFGLALGTEVPMLALGPRVPVPLRGQDHVFGYARRWGYPLPGVELWGLYSSPTHAGYVAWDPALYRELTEREVMARTRSMPLLDRIRAILPITAWQHVTPTDVRRQGQRVTFSDGHGEWFVLDLDSGVLLTTAPPRQ